MCAMSVSVAFVLFAVAMLACLVTGFSTLPGLAAGFVLVTLAGVGKGFSLRAVCGMAWQGVKRVFIVMRILLLIGLITALWRSGGVIPFCAYYGMGLVTPPLFLFLVFACCSIVSYAIGTSFGVVGTMGVIFLAIARAGGVNELMAAGAVISGAYFGDRCSPASSCAHLVAAVTETGLYGNVRAMLRSGIAPLLLAAAGFLALSVANPLRVEDSVMLPLLEQSFAMPFYVAAPLVLMLVLPLFKVKIVLAMLLSIGAAFLLTVFVQGQSVWAALRIALMGFDTESEALSRILSGGGVLSMATVLATVTLSASYSGIFRGTGMLDGVGDKIAALARKTGAYPAMLLTGTAAAMVFCNQTIATIMAQQLMKPVYELPGKTREDMALDISDSLVMTAGLVPWSIAALVPLTMLGVGPEALPYCLLLSFTPLCRLLGAAISAIKARRANKKPLTPSA